MPLRFYPAAAVLLLLTAGCAKDAPPPPSAPAAAGSGMPRFERRPLTIAEEDLPEGRYMMFDVASDGSVIYQNSPEKAPLLRRIDSTGRSIDAFGSDGEGPGEIRFMVDLQIDGDTLQLYEANRFALIEMSLTGKFLRERRTPPSLFPMSWLRDSVDHWDPDPPPGKSGRTLIRSAIGKLEGRVLFDSSNSVFAAAIAKYPGERNITMSIPYLSTADRIWLADPWSYRITAFDKAGRQLNQIVPGFTANKRGPRAVGEARERIIKAPRFMRGPKGERIELPDGRGRLDTLEREQIRHFTRNPLHVDEFGRLWVVGLSRDSTSVDLFSDTTFVGRVMLPCYASAVGTRVAFGRGGWMVLECEVEGGDWPTELQLYRIIERPQGP